MCFRTGGIPRFERCIQDGVEAMRAGVLNVVLLGIGSRWIGWRRAVDVLYLPSPGAKRDVDCRFGRIFEIKLNILGVRRPRSVIPADPQSTSRGRLLEIHFPFLDVNPGFQVLRKCWIHSRLFRPQHCASQVVVALDSDLNRDGLVGQVTCFFVPSATNPLSVSYAVSQMI